MKKALIFENRLVDTAAVEFPVAPALHWIDAEDDVTCETHEYDAASKSVVLQTVSLTSPSQTHAAVAMPFTVI